MLDYESRMLVYSRDCFSIEFAVQICNCLRITNACLRIPCVNKHSLRIPCVNKHSLPTSMRAASHNILKESHGFIPVLSWCSTSRPASGPKKPGTITDCIAYFSIISCYQVLGQAPKSRLILPCMHQHHFCYQILPQARKTGTKVMMHYYYEHHFLLVSGSRPAGPERRELTCWLYNISIIVGLNFCFIGDLG
jgi:hypothetical protein